MVRFKEILIEICSKYHLTYLKFESEGKAIMSDHFLKKTMKKWIKKEKKSENQEENESKIEKEYQERKKQLAKKLEKDMKIFKKELDTK